MSRWLSDNAPLGGWLCMFSWDGRIVCFFIWVCGHLYTTTCLNGWTTTAKNPCIRQIEVFKVAFEGEMIRN